MRVPRDYARPDATSWLLKLIKLPASNASDRIGSLFLNPGGPGGSGVEFLRANATALGALRRRFDLVAFDPRGIGQSQPSVRCLTNAEATTQFVDPFRSPDSITVPALLSWSSRWVNRCVSRNRGVLEYLSTANVARDLDRLRAAVGEAKLTYLGFSYGTFIGATYASLFPRRVRALALDGAIDPDAWVNRPLEATQEQAAAFERELQRFFVHVAQRNLFEFGGDDPEAAFDHLVDHLDAHPAAAGAPYAARPPTTGDTVLAAAAQLLDTKSLWDFLAGDLNQAAGGTGTNLRGDADVYWGIDSDGRYDGEWDQNLAVSALDQRLPHRLPVYLRTAWHSYALFPHFWWSSGDFELPWGLWPVRPRGVFRGPFRNSYRNAPALVIGTRYDPSTPYVWAKRLTDQLANARLLTMNGDGHTAWFNGSSCARAATTAYLETLAVPDAGAQCEQR